MRDVRASEGDDILLKQHPLTSVGSAAAAAPEPSDGDPLFQQFNAAIGPYSTDRTKMDWPLVERVAGALAAQRCDLKVYGYLGLAAFHAAGDEESPYLPLAAVLSALGDLVAQGWARCLPKSESRRQGQLKWFSEELSLLIKQKPPRPAQRAAFAACLSQAERAAEISGTALGLCYPLLRELREALKEQALTLPVLPPPPAAAPVAPPPAPRPASPPVPAASLSPPPPAATPEQSPSASAPAPAPAPQAAVAVSPSPALGDAAALSRDLLEDQLAILVVELASRLRAESLTNPAPYWLLRALRWASHDLLRPERVAELLANKGRSLLPPPQGHMRLRKDFSQRLAAGLHGDVVTECEELFAMNPLWLDLQRFIATGLEALGAEQARAAVREQVRLLLHCCPQIAELKFSDRDGTPFADAETQRWLAGERAGDDGATTSATSATSSALGEQIPEGLLPGVQFLQKQILQASAGARRFEVQLRLVELLLASERSDIAMPIVEQLLGAIEAHRLVEWQPELCQHALRLAVQAARAAELDAAQRTALFGRMCQLSPADAVQLGPESLSS